MNRILFHSFYFPPTGGAGAQRPLKFVKYLPDHGYDPIVITAPGAAPDRWSPSDQTLQDEVPNSVDVRRIAGPEPPFSGGWRGRAERWLTIDSPWERWWVEGSTRRGLELGRDVDLIYVWMQPYISARSGARLSRKLGKPWVADLGDPWALDEMRVYPSALHRRLDLREMERLLSSAAAIVMSTQEAAHRLKHAASSLTGKPILVIPNGYDAKDFEGNVPERNDGKFRIVHTGYLHTELGREHRRSRWARLLLRGGVPGVDILTRSHVHLLEAIDREIADEPELGGLIELHLAGVLTASDRDAIDGQGIVKTLGYVTHAESIELMRSAELLFLPMQDLPAGVRATIVPGKTYEYLASGTPILAAVPEGDARDILTEAGNAQVCRPSDVDGMIEALRHELARFRRGERPRAPETEVVERFDYRTLAAELAGVFDEVVGRSALVRTPSS